MALEGSWKVGLGMCTEGGANTLKLKNSLGVVGGSWNVQARSRGGATREQLLDLDNHLAQSLLNITALNS